MVPTIKLSVIQVLGLAGFGIVLGGWLKRRLPFLDRVNIPTSIAGGLLYAIAVVAMRDRVANFDFDMVLRDVLMIAFFTTVGMSASLRLLRLGGRMVGLMLLVSVVGVFLQNGVGVAVASALGLHPLIGVLAGSVALTGGPATALAFGPTFEGVGVAGGTTAGVTSAVFGIVAGGLIGGWIGGGLIRKHDLHVKAMKDQSSFHIEQSDVSSFLTNVIALVVAMALGSLVSLQLQAWGLTLPAYIGAMICAAVIRNLDDATGWIQISQEKMDELGDISLELFIVMALLTLRLWELINLAAPIFAILVAQIALVYVMCRFLVFRVMGRDYPAAVMASGFCGFMLGTTANAMACMGEVARKYGPAPQAFFAVTIVGAFLIDFINALIINASVNLLK
jgi:glutamate:Na+ symporter, ESS family